MAHTIFNGTLIPDTLIPGTYYYFDEFIKSKIQGYVTAHNKEVAKAKHTKKFTPALNRIKNPRSRIMWNDTNYYHSGGDHSSPLHHTNTVDHVIEIARARIQHEAMGVSPPHPSEWEDEYGGYWLATNPAMRYLDPWNKKPRYVSGQQQFRKWLAQYIDSMWQLYQTESHP